MARGPLQLHCTGGFSLVVIWWLLQVIEVITLVAVCNLLIAVAFLAEYGRQGMLLVLVSRAQAQIVVS